MNTEIRNNGIILPDPMSNPRIRALRLNPIDKAAAWVITDDMVADMIAEDVTDGPGPVDNSDKRLETKKAVRQGRRKLDEDAVRSIREKAANGSSNGEIAKEYGVTQTCIWNIVKGNTWKHVK